MLYVWVRLARRCISIVADSSQQPTEFTNKSHTAKAFRASSLTYYSMTHFQEAETIPRPIKHPEALTRQCTPQSY